MAAGRRRLAPETWDLPRDTVPSFAHRLEPPTTDLVRRLKLAACGKSKLGTVAAQEREELPAAVPQVQFYGLERQALFPWEPTTWTQGVRARSTIVAPRPVLSCRRRLSMQLSKSAASRGRSRLGRQRQRREAENSLALGVWTSCAGPFPGPPET